MIVIKLCSFVFAGVFFNGCWSISFQVAEVLLTEHNKVQVLNDLLTGIQAQFKASDLTQIHVKLASVASALYFTLIKIWGK